MYQLNFYTDYKANKPTLLLKAKNAIGLYNEILNINDELFTVEIKPLTNIILDILEELANVNACKQFYNYPSYDTIMIAIACNHELKRLQKENTQNSLETRVELLDAVSFALDEKLQHDEKLTEYVLSKLPNSYNNMYDEKMEILKK